MKNTYSQDVCPESVLHLTMSLHVNLSTSLTVSLPVYLFTNQLTPADEEQLTSDDASTLSQSVSQTQSPQNTPAKEGITPWKSQLSVSLTTTVSFCENITSILAANVYQGSW